MASHGRRVTVLRHDASVGNMKEDIEDAGNGMSLHVIRRENENNGNNDETSKKHCYAKCIAGCVNPTDSKAENLCAKMCQNQCHL